MAMNRIVIDVRTGEQTIVPLTQNELDEIAARPAEPTPVVVVSPWQIRKALNAAGLRDAVESAVSGADQTTQDAWEFAQEFRRDNPLIAAVASALGKTEAEIDDLFALAGSL